MAKAPASAPLLDFKTRIAVTTSVLFDMSEADAVYREKGKDGYKIYMEERKNETLKPSRAFSYFEKLSKRDDHQIVLFSRNSTLTAIRAIHSMIELGMSPHQFVFTNGASPLPYLSTYGINLLYTADAADAYTTLHEHKIASTWYTDQTTPETTAGGKLIKPNKPSLSPTEVIHHCFDFDGVIAGRSSEDFFVAANGANLDVNIYRKHELERIKEALEQGPLFQIFKEYAAKALGEGTDSSMRVSIVTARGSEAALRMLTTLEHYGIEPNGEVHCMDGVDKSAVLKQMMTTYPAFMFFDDSQKNILSARRNGIPAAHIPPPIATP